MHLFPLLFLSTLAAAIGSRTTRSRPYHVLKRNDPTDVPAPGVTGVATFNNYAQQVANDGPTQCGATSGFSSTPYGAAVGDLSPDLSLQIPCGPLPAAGTDCNTTDPSNPQANNGYAGPNCAASTPCGTCYNVTNMGGWEGASIGGQGNSIIVQVIDSCPSNSADNYCKTNIEDAQRCGRSGLNALDIDQSAYNALTGTSYASGSTPNLAIMIESASC